MKCLETKNSDRPEGGSKLHFVIDLVHFLMLHADWKLARSLS